MSRTPPLPALAEGIIVIKPPQLPQLQLQLQLQPRSLPAPHVPPTQLLLPLAEGTIVILPPQLPLPQLLLSDSLALPLLLLCQLTLQAALVFIKEIIVILLEVNTKSNVNPITIDIYT